MTTEVVRQTFVPLSRRQYGSASNKFRCRNQVECDHRGVIPFKKLQNVSVDVRLWFGGARGPLHSWAVKVKGSNQSSTSSELIMSSWKCLDYGSDGADEDDPGYGRRLNLSIKIRGGNSSLSFLERWWCSVPVYFECCGKLSSTWYRGRSTLRWW